MSIYVGSFRNYKHYRTFLYITHLVLQGVGGWQGWGGGGPDCHPTNHNGNPFVFFFFFNIKIYSGKINNYMKLHTM